MKRVNRKGKHVKKTILKKNRIVLAWIVFCILVLFFVSLFIKNDQLLKIKRHAKIYNEKFKLEKNIGSLKNLSKRGIFKSYYINFPKFNNKNLDSIMNKQKKEIINSINNKSILDKINDLKGNKLSYGLVDYESYFGPDGIIGIAFKKYEIDTKNKKTNESVIAINIEKNEKQKLKPTYLFVGNYKSKITSFIDNYLNSDANIKKELKKNYKDFINKDADYNIIVGNDSLYVYFNSNEVLNNDSSLKIRIPFREINDVLNFNIDNRYKNINEVKKNKEVFKDNKKKMYIKKLSNFYKEYNKNSDVLSILYKGEKVEVIKSSKTFSKIKYKSKYGYILNNCLSDDIVADRGYTDVLETVYASEDVVVRKKADDKGDEIIKLAFGDSITRIGTSSNGWSEVVYDNKKAFVKSNYLSLTNPSRKINIDKNKNIDAHGLMVALTFDDGPSPSSTNRILDTLEKYHVVATFFDLGKLVKNYPDIVKREESIGCEVATHTYDHPNLNNLNVDDIKAQINSSKDAFTSVLGHDVSLLRPPYGNANDLVKANIPYPLIHWNVDTLDWKTRNKDAIISEIRKIDNLDGKIVLFHSIYETTADAIEVIVPELINQGYQLVTVSEMAYYKGVTLDPGQKYYGF